MSFRISIEKGGQVVGTMGGYASLDAAKKDAVALAAQTGGTAKVYPERKARKGRAKRKNPGWMPGSYSAQQAWLQKIAGEEYTRQVAAHLKRGKARSTMRYVVPEWHAQLTDALSLDDEDTFKALKLRHIGSTGLPPLRKSGTKANPGGRFHLLRLDPAAIAAHGHGFIKSYATRDAAFRAAKKWIGYEYTPVEVVEYAGSGSGTVWARTPFHVAPVEEPNPRGDVGYAVFTEDGSRWTAGPEASGDALDRAAFFETMRKSRVSFSVTKPAGARQLPYVLPIENVRALLRQSGHTPPSQGGYDRPASYRPRKTKKLRNPQEGVVVAHRPGGMVDIRRPDGIVVRRKASEVV